MISYPFPHTTSDFASNFASLNESLIIVINIVEKGKIAYSKQVLLMPECFQVVSYRFVKMFLYDGKG